MALRGALNYVGLSGRHRSSTDVLKLDHITVIAPTLIEGVSHVQICLDLEVPFGTRHDYMGTHNHRLQLGNNVYLEIVALDPDGTEPRRPRWFGLDNQEKVRSDWNEGRRLRGWVASTNAIDSFVSNRRAIFGDKVSLPVANPTFDFTIPADGSLPLDGVAPSIIDHGGDPTSMTSIPDLGARLHSLILEHPNPASIETLYRELSIEHPPAIVSGPKIFYRAQIETPTGLKQLS
jgi:Glyoxalase-like domain